MTCDRCQRPACDYSTRVCVEVDCGLRRQMAGNCEAQVLRSGDERGAIHAAAYDRCEVATS